MLYYQDFLYILKIIYSKLINRYYNNLLTGNFKIKKPHKLIARKFYLPILQKDIKAYIKAYNIYLASKIVCYKLYDNL